MAKVTIFLAVVLIVTVSATPQDQKNGVTLEQLEVLKETLEEQIKDDKLTCENYKDVCGLSGKPGRDPNGICQIILRSYLCEKLQDLKGVEEILARVTKAHPDTFNLEDGLELEPDDVNEEEDNLEATEMEIEYE